MKAVTKIRRRTPGCAIDLRDVARRVSLRLIAALVSLLLFAAASAAFGQEGPRPMSVVDLINVPSLGDPQLSPDGEQLLYVLRKADWEQNRTVGHIWRVAVDGSNAIQLTYGEDGESSPRWSPDGRFIAFLAERGDDEGDQIYLLDVAGGEAYSLTEHATEVVDITWSPDGGWVYFRASDEKSEEQKAREEKENDVYAFDEDYRHRHLWRISVESGEEERVTEGEYSVLSYEFSRDGEMIAYRRGPSPLYDDSDESEVWVVEVDGEANRQLTDNSVPEFDEQLSPDGEWVLFSSPANAEFEFYYNDKMFLVPSGGGDPTLLLPDLPYEVNGATWSGNGRYIYFMANTGVRRDLFRLEVSSGQYVQLTGGDHSLFGWRYYPELERHIFQISERTNPGDVWQMGAGGRSRPERITHIFDYLAEEFLLPRQETVQWTGADGVTVEGLLFYPLDYEEGRRYPLVVQTHGGPASSDKFTFGSSGDYVQKLAALGYVVFQPNYRGSTGYGDDFLRDMVGHYFQNAHLDVMTGVDYLIERGLVDGERMAKMGWSAGGHMTNKIITFTQRFKAAASGAGASNWVSMYGQSDVRIYRTPWFGGTPWEENAPIDVYWENSPLSDVSKVTTPTIFLVGQDDQRVPMPQSVEIHRALKANGVPTHLYVAPRQGHGWRELRHRLFKANVELDWFERWVMERDYEWETAPGDEEKESVTSAADVHR
ncbi:MAG: S9 family peptidase [Gemmatimonadota bacterium]|nr:MAG: S9 family peptidase [Gemmatimonadota bacterium]